MAYEIGSRVGAIYSAQDEGIRFIGFGVYEGDFTPPGNNPAPSFEELMADPEVEKPEGATHEQLLANYKAMIDGPLGRMLYFNPRIRLDNGSIVWGRECWWGPEDRVQGELDAAKAIIDVTFERDEVGFISNVVETPRAKD